MLRPWLFELLENIPGAEVLFLPSNNNSSTMRRWRLSRNAQIPANDQEGFVHIA